MTKKKSTTRRPKQDHSRKGVPTEFTNADRGIRLQKALADAGVASRREAEQMIEEGRVSVNKKLVTALPAFVDPKEDFIRVDGKAIHKLVNTKANERKVCIMLNKPRHCICTSDDPQGRRTVLDMVQYDNMPRLFPIGRLDAESTGLLLLTNDGELSQQLTHPSYGVPKTYNVSIRGKLLPEDIEKLKKGLVLAHRAPRGMKVKRAHATEVKLLNFGRGGSGDRTNVSITLREGQNREIRRLIAGIGYKVRRLERVSIGPLVLKGLATGHWRMLESREINSLKKAAKQAKAQSQKDE
ncbi:MAG: pseudouridine synthase [Phycisphaeraceae bacterium JB051]